MVYMLSNSLRICFSKPHIRRLNPMFNLNLLHREGITTTTMRLFASQNLHDFEKGSKRLLSYAPKINEREDMIPDFSRDLGGKDFDWFNTISSNMNDISRSDFIFNHD